MRLRMRLRITGNSSVQQHCKNNDNFVCAAFSQSEREREASKARVARIQKGASEN